MNNARSKMSVGTKSGRRSATMGVEMVPSPKPIEPWVTVPSKINTLLMM